MPSGRRVAQGLYDPAFEHDACGVSFVVHMKGLRSHGIVTRGVDALCALEHRGASGSEVNTGDGAGILIQIPDRFLREVVGFPLPPEGSYATGIAFLPADHDRADEGADAVEKIKQGNDKAIGAIMGAVMRETKGRADGAEVQRMIRERIGA